MGDDGSVSPVFGVKAPSGFSTKYPEDNSQVFSAQGLVEVDQLGSPYGDCSKELFSDAEIVTILWSHKMTMHKVMHPTQQ